jgi:hypothetical protein
MKRRQDEGKSGIQATLPFPLATADPTGEVRSFESPPNPSPGHRILDHLSQSVKQDAALLIERRLTSVALPELLTILRSLNERDGPTPGTPSRFISEARREASMLLSTLALRIVIRRPLPPRVPTRSAVSTRSPQAPAKHRRKKLNPRRLRPGVDRPGGA